MSLYLSTGMTCHDAFILPRIRRSPSMHHAAPVIAVWHFLGRVGDPHTLGGDMDSSLQLLESQVKAALARADARIDCRDAGYWAGYADAIEWALILVRHHRAATRLDEATLLP